MLNTLNDPNELAYTLYQNQLQNQSAIDQNESQTLQHVDIID